MCIRDSRNPLGFAQGRGGEFGHGLIQCTYPAAGKQCIDKAAAAALGGGVLPHEQGCMSSGGFAEHVHRIGGANQAVGIGQ